MEEALVQHLVTLVRVPLVEAREEDVVPGVLDVGGLEVLDGDPYPLHRVVPRVTFVLDPRVWVPIHSPVRSTWTGLRVPSVRLHGV